MTKRNQKEKAKLLIFKEGKEILWLKKRINNNDINNDEMLLKSISKINQIDVDKKLKRINKSFNQAYFHLRNNNLKY